MTLLSCHFPLLQVIFGAGRDGFRALGPPWRAGGIKPFPSVHQKAAGESRRSLSFGEKGAALRGRRNISALPSWSISWVFWDLVVSQDYSSLRQQFWVTDHLGKVWSCPWVTPLALEMDIFHLGLREMMALMVYTPSQSPGEARGPQGWQNSIEF